MRADQGTVIVAGVDGSGTDDAAWHWAAQAAEAQGVPLVLVHASEVFSMGALDGDVPWVEPDELQVLRGDGPAPQVAAEVAAQATRQHPGLTVEVDDTFGSPARTLVTYSDDALMVVVGSGRKGTFDQIMLGSTSLETAMYARCPVVVVGSGESARSRVETIVVAMDGSVGSERAARFAFAVAATRAARVVALSSWYVEVVDGYVITEPDSPEWAQIERRQRRRVEAGLDEARRAYPDVPVEVTIDRGPSTQVLVQHTTYADLLVMGRRGRGGFVGKLLGSTTHRLLHQARCPVAVVPAE